MQEEKEIWKTIPECPNHQVSSLGRIKSLERKVKSKNGSYRTVRERILKPGKVRGGYLIVSINNEGIQKSMFIHRLVASAFLINTNNLPQINHKNEIKEDNRVENLEYCDARYNTNYGSRNKRAGIAISKAKKGIINTKKSKSVICIETGVIYPSTAEAQRQLGFLQSNICNCCNGKRNTCGGYHWRYVE